jgi:peptide/nickel transport system permease protein
MKNHSLWKDAFFRLAQDKLALSALFIVLIYFLVALLSSLGIIASNWSQEVGASNLAPSWDHLFGTDIFGRSVLQKVVRGTQVAMSVGIAASVIAIPIGVILGALAGYFGGWVDDFVTWLYTTFSSVPNIMLLISITLILGKGIFAVYVALGATSWVTLCRLIRGEVMKHKEREYVQAAAAIGGGHFRKLFRHILPNVSHIIIINTFNFINIIFSFIKILCVTRCLTFT